jgi:predicted nucleic acid-binding protein
MKKVFIDSSVWVSFLAEDRNRDKAEKIFRHLLGNKDERIIIVPRLIYLEVMNNMLKLNLSADRIALFKNLFKTQKKIRLEKTNEKIYIKAEENAKKVRLKTLDLLIVTTVLEHKADRFISFDKRLRKSHHKLLNS